MAAKSTYLDNAVLNHVLRNTALTSPPAVFAGLFTVAPTAGTPGSVPSTSGTEVSGGSYARVAVTFGAPSIDICTNTPTVVFPTATALWGTVVAVGIFDGSSNLLYFGTLSLAKIVDNGDTASFGVAALSITEQ